MKKSRKSFISVLGIISMGALLTGCAFMPLPNEQRYKRVNNILDQIDYEEIGVVIKKNYDNGDGVFKASYFSAWVEGDRVVYENLEQQILNIENIKCDTSTINVLSCDIGVTDINIAFRKEKNPQYTTLKITDPYSGRDVNEIKNGQ